jgi:CTP synthase
MTAPLVLVEHHATDPVEDCVAAAGVLALVREGTRPAVCFRRLVYGSQVRDPNAFQHVAPAGALVNNAWLWPERLAGQSADPGLEILPDDLDPDTPAVVAFNTAGASPPDPSGWVSSWRESRPVLHLRVVGESGTNVIRLTGQAVGENSGMVGRWTNDAWARPRLDLFNPAPLGAMFKLPSVPGAPAIPERSSGTTGTILVVGEEYRLRRVYPAILAALGDAADALGIDPAVRIVSPLGLSRVQAHELVRTVDGIVLPGGCDISQVEGQIEIAAAALALDTPALGCCFGMQTMVTAFARERLDAPGANLEEVDRDADPLVFIAMRDSDGRPRHRLGLRSFDVAPGSKAQAFYAGLRATERMHHRYRLDPRLWPALQAAGLVISGRSENDGMADVIEAPGRRFFVGVQGHPELSSSNDHPHPAFKAFLAEAVGHMAE